MAEEYKAIGRNIPYPERGMYYPAWARDFAGFEKLELKNEGGDAFIKGKDGEPVLLEDVAPERRWAVDFETGRLINQRDFKDLYVQWLTMACPKGGNGQIVAMNANNKYYAPEMEPVPNIKNFVLRRPDGGQIEWKELRVGDFRPPSQAHNEQLIAKLVEGLGGAGFQPAGTAPAQPTEVRQVAEVRPKFQKVPAPSEG